MELISIIMPTYKNEGKSLQRAITSITNQSYPNWELIIIDDNNDTYYSSIALNIVNCFNDSRIHYHKNYKNLGSAKSRNIGIRKSNGLYITFLDDDDVYLDSKLEKQITIMTEQNADFSIMDLNIYDDKEKLIRKRRHSYLAHVKSNKDLLVTHLKYHLTGTDTFMYSRKFIFSIGLFDEIDLGDEFYLMLKSILHQGKFAYLPEALVKAYSHPNGIGLTAGANKEDGENALYKNKKQYFYLMSKNDIKFISMRHHLVLLSCNLRQKKYMIGTLNLIKAFILNPTEFIRFILSRKEY